tara:strand:- start:4610 stop:4996 length:387 start_codon:yes stop_codon:yes gene_type:complete
MSVDLSICKLLDEFRSDPYNISDKKIARIKEYFYPRIFNLINVSQKGLQVSVNNNTENIYFKSDDYYNIYYNRVLVLNIVKNTYYYYELDLYKEYDLRKEDDFNSYDKPLLNRCATFICNKSSYCVIQ